ncbi:MAG: hypothetical protein AAF487_01040 [Bacteroidota bacterium]
MRRMITMAIAIMIGSLLFAQENQNNEQQTLFGNKRGFGGFIGLNSQAAQINGQEAYLTGAELNMVLGHSLNIGVKGMGLVSDIESNTFNDDGDAYKLQMGYGGVNIEPVIASKSVLHVTTPLFLGIGGIAETYDPLWEGDIINGVETAFDQKPHRTDMFLMAEPGVNLELNVFKFMRLTGGVSYKFVTDTQIPGIETSDIEGLSANLSLRLGWF